jgi:phosphatidylserine/phosphatidylglycerophosphate/cardiolipin synthase-like enzyme
MEKRRWIAAGLALLATLSAVDIFAFAGGECGHPPEGTGHARDTQGASAVLNEILPAPGKAFDEEFIELFNPGTSGADIGGWSLDDIPDGGSKPFLIPNGTVIPAGGYLVFYNSTTRIVLNNDGDTVRLLDAGGGLRDIFIYNSSDHDVSWGRVPDASPDWRELDRPTPGVSNPSPKPASEEGRRLLLTQVYYHAYFKKGDEFSAVSNPSASPVDLSGWTISDNDSMVIFPEGTQILPGRTIFITGNSSDFLSDMGVPPDISTTGASSCVTRANATGRWPSMLDDGGWLSLKDPTGWTVDTFAWGNSTVSAAAGWDGPPACGLDSGRVARRARGPSGAWLDTNSSADWPRAAGTVVGRTEMAPGTFDAEWVKSFVSPDCSFDAVAGELESARSSIMLAVYQFESLSLAEKLVNASRRGVAARVLLEGFPVGGITDQERWVVQRLSESGVRVLFLASNHSSGEGDRYEFMHAKYCVIDGLDCIVGSENWKNSGIPPDPRSGNRGWGAVVRSRGLAAYLGAVFENDSSTAFRDIFPYSVSDSIFGPPPAYFIADASIPAGNFSPRFKTAVFQGGIRVSPVLSPDTSSLPDGPLLAMIGSARDTLFIEQMACDIEWNVGGTIVPNGYLAAAVDAARRGVEVKVLLDGTYLDPSEPSQDNTGALDYLQYTAFKEGLDIQARIAKIPGTLKLHNKGVVVDGEKVLVSTINWGATSVYQNREVGLVIEGAGPAGYFQQVFLDDWEQSSGNGTRHANAGQYAGFEPAKMVALLLPALLVAAAAVLIILRAGARRRRRDYIPEKRRHP